MGGIVASPSTGKFDDGPGEDTTGDGESEACNPGEDDGTVDGNGDGEGSSDGEGVGERDGTSRTVPTSAALPR